MAQHAGDDGKTTLLNGGRISKAAVELCAIGDLDELSAAIGAAVAALPEHCAEMKPVLVDVQRTLSHICSFCAGYSGGAFDGVLGEALIDLDRWITVWNDALPTLRHLVLLSGHGAACAIHLARTVCRRAERSFVAMVEARDKKTDRAIRAVMAYLNRLSLFLFLLARLINFREGVGEKVIGGR